MIEMYNYQRVKLDTKGGDKIVIKRNGSNAVVIDGITSDPYELDTSAYVADQYAIMWYRQGEIIASDTILMKQNLEYAGTADVRSHAQITLEAITAYIEGHATAQQKEVQIGDKKISYSSLDELLKCKRYFEEEVRKEEGKPIGIRHEKIYWRGI